MKSTFLFQLVFLLAAAVPAAELHAAPPPKAPDVPTELPPKIEVLQPGVKLTLLAEHPALVTPTGIDVDESGRIWVVSCHTHFRPEGYEGPEHDEILVFDRDGKNRRVFYNKTDMTMNVKLGGDGWVYLAERSRILRVKDADGDGAGDLEENVAVLDTTADYPHNGLSGLAWLPGGELMFSLGENFGKDWTLKGRDGAELTGRGEGGVFRCRPDGTGLHRIARGFWNPFGLLVRRDGEMFAVENDPGSRPPCRLLSIVEGADYGFQWVYGSAPVHPFVAWNGELRGTLGMIHPSGEGPCALVELGGGVMAPSWSNHRIDYFPLTRQGAGYVSQLVTLLRGSDFFRPTCMAPGPDGAFYFSDWVFSSYALHGCGRLWKLEIDREKATWLKAAAEPPNAAAKLANELREGTTRLSEAELFEHARGGDPYLADAALTALARSGAAWTPDHLRALAPQDRVWALVALRRVNLEEKKWVRLLLDDPDPEIRFECLRWIADAVLVDFSADVERILAQPDLDYRLFEAALAAWNTLRGKPEAGVTDADTLAERVTNPATPARLKGYALRLAPASHAKFATPLLQKLLAENDPVLSLEVVRTLSARNADDAREALAEIAADETRGAGLRAEAIAGLASTAKPEHLALLLKLATHETAAIRNEALRALRSSPLDAAARDAVALAAERHPESSGLTGALLQPDAISAGRPPAEDTAAWLKRLDALPGAPDVEAGRRIFFHSRVALCSNCHRHSGRGNVVGPDLSFVSRQGDRRAILQSILEPSRDVAPQFFPTQLELHDGTLFTGILLRSSHVDVFRDVTGKERVFQKDDYAQRTELKTSVMPTGLAASLTDGELRDLLAFLMSAGGQSGKTAAIQAPLWPGKAPVGDGSYEASSAEVQVFLPPREKANGAAVVICPGGGYIRHVSDREGYPIAAWLNAHGIAAILLEYRLPEGRSYVPLLDAQRAIRVARARAAEWRIDPQRIGILGFSAGGHVASTEATHFDAGRAGDADPIERVSCRPDFLLLVYPVVTMGEKTHSLSKTKLLGASPAPELVRLFSNETQVSAQTPPAFLAHARDDASVPPDNSRNFVAAMKAHRIPVEYLELPSGGHGLNGCQGPLWEEWKAKALAWLALQEFIPEEAR